MDYFKTFKAYKNYLPAAFIQTANEIHNQHINLLNRILAQGRLEEDGCDEFTIDFFLKTFATMDSNNALKKLGMGEREARIATPILYRRYYGLLHGVGRSGELLSLQPKAIGSSLLHKLAHALLLDTLKSIGVGKVERCLILPLCTGMALTLCFLNLRRHKPRATKVIFLRIDQKSCLKSIYAAGLDVIIVENIWKRMKVDETREEHLGVQKSISELGFDKQVDMQLELSLLTTPLEETASILHEEAVKNFLSVDNDEYNPEGDNIPPLFTNCQELERILEEINLEDVLCILSTTSCFAPREPDNVSYIGKIARKNSLFHVINNAYGLQCSLTINEINKLARENLVDYVVQSTDKNFMTPVGGSIVFSYRADFIDEVNKNYPGRASANACLDLFIALMSLGRKKLISLRLERKQIFTLIRQKFKIFCEKVGEKVIYNKRNKISIAVTLHRFAERANEFGSWLFKKGVSGARVVTKANSTNIQTALFENYGGHVNGDYPGFPYLAFAISIGISMEEAENFVEIFCDTYYEFLDASKNN